MNHAEMLTQTFNASVSVLIIVLVGVAMRKLNWLTKEAYKPLTDITMNVLCPCATFFSIRGNEQLQNIGFVGYVVLVGYLSILLGLIVAVGFMKSCGWMTGLKTDAQRRTFLLCSCLYNYGYLPIPLVLLLFGTKTLGMLFVFNVGVAMGMWTIAIAVLDKNAFRQSLRQLYSPPMVGSYLAILLNFIPGTQVLPVFVETPLKWIYDCMNPLSLLLVGGMMLDEFTRKEYVHTFLESIRIISCALAVRMLLIPVLFFLCAEYLISNVDLQRVIVVQAAMPTAIMSLVWSRMFGGEPATALRVVIATNLLSIITVLIWIPLGLKWLNIGPG